MYQTFWEHMLLFKKLYDTALDPVAQQNGLTRMELDLLLFLHNNPDRSTAAEAVRLRRWTKSHVSAAVHTLKKKGLLSAIHPPGNRKTIRLTPLPAAQAVICQGAAAQALFIDALHQGVTAEEFALLEQIIQKIARNIQSTQTK